jgi:hypothetical protein
MSKNLSAVAVTAFDSEVKHAYQGSGRLRNKVTLRTGVVGDTYKFRLMGKGLANQKATSADVTPMDITHSQPTATLTNWNAPEYTDIFDQSEVNFDEKAQLAMTIGKALSRREDQLIIAQLTAGTYNTTATDAQGFSIVAGGTGFTFEKLLALKAYYADLEIDEMPCICVEGAALQDLLSEQELTSADYQNVKGLVNGTLENSTAMGFEFITIGSRRAEGGLGGNAYSFVKSAVGHAVGRVDNMVDVNWIAQKTSWLCNGMLKAGSTLIDPEGTAKIAYA